MRRERHSTTRRRVRTPPVSDPTLAPAGHVPEKWSWHFQALQKLRDHLLDDLRVKLATASEPVEPHGMDPAESATDEFDHDLAINLVSGERNALREIESAMQRILNGTYGICGKTGKRIEEERLRAVPWTRFSRDAQDMIEGEKRRKAPAGRANR
jgi:RNA polymerase-binding transcription factor DksA